MMNEEQHLKLQYKSSSCLTSFLGGLFEEIDGYEDEEDANRQAMKKMV
jgi:hypothetical protein